jgi:hypothetical protein
MTVSRMGRPAILISWYDRSISGRFIAASPFLFSALSSRRPVPHPMPKLFKAENTRVVLNFTYSE